MAISYYKKLFRTINIIFLMASVIVIIPQKMVAKIIFVHTNATPLTAEEHKICYKVKLETQFPTAFYYNKNYDPVKNKLQVVQDSIDKAFINNTIQAQWIPTVIYELFYLKNYDFSQPNRGSYDLTRVSSGTCSNKVDYLAKYNTNANYLKKDYECNNTVAEYLLKFPKKINSNPTEYFMHLAEKISYDRSEIELVKKAIALEEKNNVLGDYSLYRGGKLPEFSSGNNAVSDGIELSLISNSYGNSLFAGMLNDPGACAYIYTLTSDKGYSLSINKAEYIKFLHKLFFIPPLATLVALEASGEFFHARTTFACPKEEPQKNLQGVCSIDSTPGYLFMPGTPKEKKRLVQWRQKYFFDHAEALTKKTEVALDKYGEANKSFWKRHPKYFA